MREVMREVRQDRGRAASPGRGVQVRSPGGIAWSSLTQAPSLQGGHLVFFAFSKIGLLLS